MKIVYVIPIGFQNTSSYWINALRAKKGFLVADVLFSYHYIRTSELNGKAVSLSIEGAHGISRSKRRRIRRTRS